MVPPIEQSRRLSFWQRLTPGLPPAAVRIAAVSAAMLLFFRVFSAKKGRGSFYYEFVLPWLGRDNAVFFGMEQRVWYATSSFVLFFVIPLLVALLGERDRCREIGLGFGDWRKGMKWTLLFVGGMLPVVLIASFTPTFQRYYPMYDLKKAAVSPVAAFVMYEFFMLLFFMAWEFFFRGYMLFSLERHFGKVAILMQMIPFAVLHGGKPLPEAIGSIFVGILLGYFALYTRTFLYCAVIHWLVAFSMDLAAMLQKAGFGPQL